MSYNELLQKVKILKNLFELLKIPVKIIKSSLDLDIRFSILFFYYVYNFVHRNYNEGVLLLFYYDKFKYLIYR